MEINTSKLKKAKSVLALLTVGNHRRIITLLTSSGPMRVIDIAEEVDMKHANTSRAVNRLKVAGILANQQNGRNVFYTVDLNSCKRVTKAIDLLAG